MKYMLTNLKYLIIFISKFKENQDKIISSPSSPSPFNLSTTTTTLNIEENNE